VTVISQHRFDPSTEIAVEAIQRGALGRLTSGIAAIDWWRGQSYYDSGDWRGTWELDGGGALMNQGVHTVDLLVATMGRPVEVFAYTGTLAHQRIEVEDVAVGVVRFESGALGVLHATTAAYPGLSARLQVHGDKGSVVIDNDELTFIHLSSPDGDAEEKMMGKVDTSENQVEAYRTEAPGPSGTGSNPAALTGDAHRRQYENFLAALAGEESLRVDLETNRQAIAIITGAYESARTGRPVRLV
jgi:UDP-N-acetyl-2-amino-2-deoxyglucuronate dehydrogenase